MTSQENPIDGQLSHHHLLKFPFQSSGTVQILGKIVRNTEARKLHME
jgi:hypothetical protein